MDIDGRKNVSSLIDANRGANDMKISYVVASVLARTLTLRTNKLDKKRATLMGVRHGRICDKNKVFRVDLLDR